MSTLPGPELLVLLHLLSELGEKLVGPGAVFHFLVNSSGLILTIDEYLEGILFNEKEAPLELSEAVEQLNNIGRSPDGRPWLLPWKEFEAAWNR